MDRRLAAILLAVSIAIVGCAAKARSTLSDPPTPAQMRELWNEPVLASRNLRFGPGGAELAPSMEETFRLVAYDTKGYSFGYDVVDAAGREWSVKFGPEAQTEVVVSRLLWAAGFHQLPTYYVPRWRLDEDGTVTVQPAGRFRLDRDNQGTWSWRENPFVDTRPFGGLFVLMVMVNNWDVKDSQNALYPWQPGDPGEGARQIYVVKDLGASLGKTPWMMTFGGNRNDLEGFEEEGFIKAVDGNRVEFHYGGAWRASFLKDEITTADVRWTAERLSRLSAEQWRDAFLAGGYTGEVADRYIRRLREKVAEGLAVGPSGP